MKRIGMVLGTVLALAVLGTLFPKTDVGKLQPVQVIQVIQVTKERGVLTVVTDTGESGIGKNLSEAIDALKATASGQIFMDTADYLLVGQNCAAVLEEAGEILRPGTRVCIVDGEVDMEKVGSFLSIHKPEVTLARCRNGIKGIPVLTVREGRMELDGKTDRS